MRVTDISPQQRHAYIFNVYVDGKFKFGLSDTELRQHDIHIGIDITEKQIDELKHLANTSKAYSYCLNYIARRPRSCGELADYLRRKDYEPAVAEQVIDRLLRNKMLDDADFARIWVENRILLKPSSRRRLTQELRQKKIEPDIIDQILTRLDPDIELQQACTLIQKKMKNPSYIDQQKLIQYMLHQGFPFSVVKQALELATSEDQS